MHLQCHQQQNQSTRLDPTLNKLIKEEKSKKDWILRRKKKWGVEILTIEIF
jgi:hypothetical protein